MSSAPEAMTLRQKLIEGDHLARELLQHLEQGFAPKIQHLKRLSKPRSDASEEEIREISVRSAVEDVLASDDFTRRISLRLQQFVASIDQDVGRIVREG